jgi:hypothetical protein
LKLSFVPLVLVVALAGSGCPDRKETINAIGGAPKAQIDEAQKRLDKAEAQLQKNAASAAAANE